MGCRTVIGSDLCLNSLRLAEEFRTRHGLRRARFAQMNLFRPAFHDETFDYVLANGVLHHTSDPRGGFRSIARLVKPGGYIVIGLYNRYGRLLLDARRVMFRLTGNRFKNLDPYLRSEPLSKAKRDAWFADQYLHPHESKHTLGEVLDWFGEAGIDFVNAIPKPTPWEPFVEGERLFEPCSPGTRLDRALAQGKSFFTGSREGGFFIVIGRRRAS